MRRATLFCIAFLLALAGCGSLTDEPRIVATSPSRVVSAPAANQPADASPGARLFAERCSACHGEGGQGDGPLVRAGQIAAPPDFTQPATMTVQGTQALFDTITTGRIEKMMPPWGDALSEQERWALAEYVVRLGNGQQAAGAATEAQVRPDEGG
jgi:mono/diheme cytochrome c family protein